MDGCLEMGGESCYTRRAYGSGNLEQAWLTYPAIRFKRGFLNFDSIELFKVI